MANYNDPKKELITAEKCFCFCTLAVGSEYRRLAKNLAESMKKYASDVPLIVLTDGVNDFGGHDNVEAFQHNKVSIHLYHDKVFVLEKALSVYRSAIFIDADIEFKANAPEVNFTENTLIAKKIPILEHKPNRSGFRSGVLKKLINRTGLDPKKTFWVGAGIFGLTGCGEKVKSFLECWKKCSMFFALRNIHVGDGNSIGIAAAKSGLRLDQEQYDSIRKAVVHHEITKERKKGFKTIINDLARNFLALARLWIKALKEYKFYH